IGVGSCCEFFQKGETIPVVVVKQREIKVLDQVSSQDDINHPLEVGEIDRAVGVCISQRESQLIGGQNRDALHVIQNENCVGDVHDAVAINVPQLLCVARQRFE